MVFAAAMTAAAAVVTALVLATALLIFAGDASEDRERKLSPLGP